MCRSPIPINTQSGQTALPEKLAIISLYLPGVVDTAGIAKIPA